MALTIMKKQNFLLVFSGFLQQNPYGMLYLRYFLDENKEKIKSTKISEQLVKLEKTWLNSHNVVEHQAGFCAQWCLDNSCKNTKLSTKRC